jgi:hypothetical protein
MIDRPRIGRIARFVAILTPAPLLIGLAMSRSSEDAVGAGFLGSVAVGVLALVAGTVAWGRIRMDASLPGVLMWILFGGGLIAFLVIAARALSEWTF